YDGIPSVAFERSKQLPFGQVELLLPVINPTEAVQISAVLGFEIERALDHIVGLIQLDSLIGEHVAEIVESARVVRIEFQQLAEHRLGLIKLLEAFQHGGLREQNWNLLLRRQLLSLLDCS